jgi:sugar/nucleoside kinase (ribokinase family)
MPQTVLFVGDVNVDLNLSGLLQDPIPDREILASDFEVAIGSSAAIAAVAHASLGARTAFLGLAGDDDYGRFMKTRMAEAGIDVSRIDLAAGLRTGVTVNLVKDHHRTQITYPGAIPLLQVVAEDFAGIDGLVHVHFAGIYQQKLLLPRLAGLIEALHGRGITASVDPQWDESEQWLHSREWLKAADVVFVNADEARSLTKTATVAAAADALAAVCRCLIVKDGSAGALVREHGRESTVAGHEVALADSIGAGDNFAAGYLFARLQTGADAEGALRFGNAAAARSCSFAGGTGARSTRADIVQFLKERE